MYLLTQVCEHCDEAFTTAQYPSLPKPRRFCSRACANTHGRYFCPVCGARLLLRSRENEDDPWLLTDAGVLHHSCLVAVRAIMAEEDLPESEAGARQAISRFHAAVQEALEGMKTHPTYAWDSTP